LAVIAAINAAIAMAYYLRVVDVMYFRASPTTGASTIKAEGGAGAWWAMVACTLLVLGVSVCPGPIISVTDHAAHAIREAQPIDEEAINSALPSHLSMRP
jgi:NADH:ubiquinone oxidoreductase subunit 2 (subunit N)